MGRKAHCQCGSFSATASGDPQMVGICHCEHCQRRTGSVFGVGAFYLKDQVVLDGGRTVFTQKSAGGNEKRFSFCPVCGVTVYWELDAFPDLCCVAVGAFADTSFGVPSISWWEKTAHDWIHLPEEIIHMETQ